MNVFRTTSNPFLGMQGVAEKIGLECMRIHLTTFINTRVVRYLRWDAEQVTNVATLRAQHRVDASVVKDLLEPDPWNAFAIW